MDTRFSAWLRDAMADVDEDILKKRWAGVETLSTELSHKQVLDLILYCANGRMRTPDTLPRVKQGFWDNDNAFDMDSGEIILQKLCGAIVMHLLCTTEKENLEFALAISVLNFCGLHPSFSFPPMVEQAELILQNLSAEVRSAPVDLVAQRRLASAAKLLETSKEKREATLFQEALGELDAVFAEYGKAVNQLIADNKRMRIALDVQKEETDILWWLTGRYSNDLDQSFGDFDKPIAAIIAGKELADLVCLRPGPLSVLGILRRIVDGGSGDKVSASLAEIVSNTPVEWQKLLTTRTDGLTLEICPILAALSSGVDHDNETGWEIPFKKRFPMAIDQQIDADVLALQCYRECMLAIEISTWP